MSFAAAQASAPWLDESVTGREIVLSRDLKRALGDTTWHVWMVLMKCRAPDGETRITHRGIMHARGFVPLKHPNDVNRAMRRLEAAKLVQPIGKVFRVVPSRVGEIEAQVYVRNVFGAILNRRCEGEPSKCVVPAPTKAWMPTAARHGGTRVGAGRKGTAINVEKRIKCVQGGPSEKESSVSPIEIMKSKNVEILTRRGILLPSGEEVHAAETASGFSSISETVTDLGAVLGGNGPRRVGGLADPTPGLPAYPGHAIVAPAIVPPAPMLNPEDSAVVHATMLARWYRAAIEKRYGRQKRPILARGDVSRSKHFANLTAFAAELIAHEIAPAAWCIHRIDKWRKGKRAITPTLAWVYSLDAISDAKRWMYRVEYEHKNLGGRLVFSKAHLRLLAAYTAMHDDLYRMKKADAVAKHFPDGLYDELVDHARRDAHEIGYRLSGDVGRGKFVW